MTIQDLARNPFQTATAPMIGYVEPEIDPRNQLTLKIYNFLIEGIREVDQREGMQFVERFLQGPQEVWSRINAGIRSLPDLWSVSRCPDAALPYLKWIVGWTSELDYITDDLDAVALRRLIAASVPLWQVRGEEGALAEILQLAAAARTRTLNWFDLRIVADETSFGEEHQDFDPWLTSLPGEADADEYRMNVRIVDDGTLNRRLVRNLVRLSRPSCERVTITYIGFLDQFTVDDDTSQWALSTGSSAPVVQNGLMTVSPTCSAYVNVPGSDSWRNYVFTARVRGRYIVLQGYRTSDGDNYLFVLNADTNTFQLGVFVAGYNSLLDTVSLAQFGVVLDASLFYAVRVELVPEDNGTRIRVLIDGNMVLSRTHSTHAAGTIAVAGIYSPYSIEVDDVELFFNPCDQDEVGITQSSE